MITNIELDLYFIVIKSSAKFEWNQYIPSKLLNEKSNDDTADDDDADRQHDPYVSAMLRRRHKK